MIPADLAWYKSRVATDSARLRMVPNEFGNIMRGRRLNGRGAAAYEQRRNANGRSRNGSAIQTFLKRLTGFQFDGYSLSLYIEQDSIEVQDLTFISRGTRPRNDLMINKPTNFSNDNNTTTYC